MSEAKLPPTPELKDALLQVLAGSPNGMNTKAIDEAVANRLKLTPEQMGIIRSGNRTEFAYRLAWERTNAKNKGLIEKTDARTWKLVTA
jgi:restriction endonuclease Mrr